jgi:splicing factor U2AF subunit
VGSLPPSANEFSTSTFFNQALRAVSGAVENTPGDPVLNAYFNVEKRFAFVEFRSIIETSNALGLDGVVMDGQAIRIRRPNDYNAAAAAALGPSLPSQSLNLAMVGMAGAAGGATNTTAPVSAEDQANRLFIGGLPYFLTDQMVKELVEAFGVTKSFKLVIDPETGNSKGYGFFVYQDPSVTDVACQGLHGMKMGEKTLTVKRAGESKGAASQGTAAPQAPAGYGYAVPGGDGKGLSCFTTFRLPDCPYETDIYFYNLRRAAPKPAAAAAAAGGFGNTVARPPVQPAVARRVPVRHVRNRRAPG